MKTLVKVKFCDGFIKALKDVKKFPDLHMYCRDWAYKMDTDDTIICELVDDYDKNGKPKKSLDIELSLFDYFFNVSCEEDERERRNLWALCNSKITREIINIIRI